MEKHFRTVTKEVAPISPVEQAYPEFLQLRRPPAVTAEGSVDQFKTMIDDMITDLAAEETVTAADFGQVLTSTELDYLQTAIELQKTRSDRFLTRMAGQLERKLSAIEQQLVVDLEEQAEIFENFAPQIEQMITTINARLQNISGYQPFHINEIAVLLMDLQSKQDDPAVIRGGAMRQNGTVILNRALLRQMPAQMPHDFIHEALHVVSTRVTEHTAGGNVTAKRTGLRYRDKTGLQQFDFFNEGAIERTTMRAARDAGVEVPLSGAYKPNRRALKAMLSVLKQHGYADATQLLDQAVFGDGNVTPFIKAIDRSYFDTGGFKQLRTLSNAHQEAVRTDRESDIKKTEDAIVRWAESALVSRQ